MCLVAFFAVGDNHFSRVRFVALGALRDLAVDTVTEGAVKGAMLALIVPELGNLLCVTGDAHICYFACKRNFQRSMRVLVTVQASLNLEVGLPHMALAALGDGFFDFRRMSDMTACTPNILVLSSCCCKVSRRSIVTLQTVFVCQSRFCLGSRGAGVSQKHRDTHD